jgi:hypothetical protein
MDSPTQDPNTSVPRYRAISPWALLSVTCGAASVLMIFGWMLAWLPLLAIYFGRKALRHIERVPEEYTGKSLAKTGIALGAALGILLGGRLFFVSDVPPGYQVLDWSDLEPGPNGTASEAARRLSDNKVRVFVRGYMLSGKRQLGLNEFSICRTSDMCKFQTPTPPKPGDLIRIKCGGDLTSDFTTHQISVGGVFRVDQYTVGSTPYYIDADYLPK